MKKVQRFSQEFLKIFNLPHLEKDFNALLQDYKHFILECEEIKRSLQKKHAEEFIELFLKIPKSIIEKRKKCQKKNGSNLP